MVIMLLADMDQGLLFSPRGSFHITWWPVLREKSDPHGLMTNRNEASVIWCRN